MRLRVVEEVGPVGVSLHVPELKQLPEAQHQDVLADLKQGENVKKKEKKIPDFGWGPVPLLANLVLQLLRQVLGLVQREPRHELRGEDVLTAQLVDHLRYVEEGVVLQKLAEREGGPGSQKMTKHKIKIWLQISILKKES